MKNGGDQTDEQTEKQGNAKSQRINFQENAHSCLDKEESTATSICYRDANIGICA